jgi:hypothetical protein
VPKRVFASLSKIVDSRPDGKGGMAPCLTWDNATLACTVEHAEGYSFPLFFEHKRMSPGMADTWYIEVDGMKASARFTTRDPNLFRFCLGGDKEQAWSTVEVGYVPAIPTITGNIFGFGFSDSLLQMWAAYLAEMDGGAAPGAVGAGFGCLTPQETRMSHAIMTAALASGKSGGAEPVDL